MYLQFVMKLPKLVHNNINRKFVNIVMLCGKTIENIEKCDLYFLKMVC